MPSLATSPLAPVLGKHVPLRGPSRLLLHSYARTRHPQQSHHLSVTTVTGDIFQVDRSSNLEWQLWAFGSWERHFAELFGRLVRPGDHCLDVGANIGVHTVRLAKLTGPGGLVTAVEPDPGLAVRLGRNVALNGLENVRVVNAAATDRAGEMTLYRPGELDTNRGRASLVRHPYLTGASTTVPGRTLDEICGGNPVSLIKIDVEGHESTVVRGATQVLGRSAPAVIFEYWPEILDDPRDTPFDWLADQGYDMFQIRADRHALTGRARLTLTPLSQRPTEAGDVLALRDRAAARTRLAEFMRHT